MRGHGPFGSAEHRVVGFLRRRVHPQPPHPPLHLRPIPYPHPFQYPQQHPRCPVQYPCQVQYPRGTECPIQ
eukprot:2631715-Rhodomonas_salina.1